MKIKIKLYGPFTWFGSDDKTIFCNELASEQGVYLFTAPYKDKYLIYYVGETGITFAERLAQHLQAYLSGQYHVYKSKYFVKGKRKPVFEGWANADDREKSYAYYFRNCSRIGKEMMKYLEVQCLFVLPFKTSQRKRQRIEAAIAVPLYEQDPPIGTFQDEITYRPKWDKEKAMTISISNASKILGLSSEIEA